MQVADLVAIFTAPLEGLGLRYFVTGSIASLVYGEPRMTHDVDLVLTVHDLDVPALVRAFPDEAFYRPPEEVIRIELRRTHHGHFNLIHHETGFKADIYLTGRDDLHAWAMARRTRAGVSPHDFWVAPIEYVILRKLAWFREGGSEKHLRDIRSMIAVSADRLEVGTLESWLERLGLKEEWTRVMERTGP